MASRSVMIRVACSLAASSTVAAFLVDASRNENSILAARQDLHWPLACSPLNGTTTECSALHTLSAHPEKLKYKLVDVPERAYSSNHAIYGLLVGDDMVEKYEVYKRSKEDDPYLVLGLVKFGRRLNGHDRIVHGGIISLMLDDIYGMAFYAMGIDMAFTANLNIDYRSPIAAGSSVKIAVELERQEGRKLFFKSKVYSNDGSTLHAESSSLYIIPRNAFKK